MSSSHADRPVVDKPPAATTGSPGTAIFSPPPSQPKHSVYSSQPQLSTSTTHLLTKPPTLPPSWSNARDRVPVQWSFESSYGLFGPPGGAILASTSRDESRPSSGLGGSWFGKKRDRDRDKDPKTRVKPVKLKADKSKVDLSSSSTAPSGEGITPSTTPDPSAVVQPTCTRPTRSPPHSAGGPKATPIIEIFHDFRESLNESIAEPMPLSRVGTSPLPVILASNTPTPRPSRSPSPSAVDGVSRPYPHSFRPTSANRPGSSSGFKGPPNTAPLMHVSNAGTTRRRRPATSSGLPNPQHGGPPDKLSVYSAPTSAAQASGVSLAPSTVSSTSESPVPSKETAAQAARRWRLEARGRGFKIKNGKRHHPRPKEEAPYPRDYERKTTDHDIWGHQFTVQLAKSSTFHEFTTPPAKVLDLGCGTGDWILQCAREWKETQFVGLDLVPIQPDLTRLGQTALASRIEWVLGNFLEPLPFEDGEFDMVHVTRVARGVPEDRWDALLEEVTRVLKKGGAFEMIEEDLFFPGSVLAAEEGSSGDEVVEGESEREEKIESSETQRPSTPPYSAPLLKAPGQMTNEMRASDSAITVRPGPPRRRATVGSRDSDSHSSIEMMGHEGTMATDSGGESRLRDYEDDSSATDSPSTGESGLPVAIPRPTTSNASQGRPLSSSAPGEGLPRMSLDSWRERGRTVADVLSQPYDSEPESEVKNLYHAHTNPIMNPRDHSVLEAAYNELHAARFINLTPLSVLNSELVLHFKDVRTHAPIQLAFPPTSTRAPSRGKHEALKKRRMSLFTPGHASSESLHARARSSTDPTPNQPSSHAQEHSRSLLNIGMLRPLGKAMPHRETNRLPNKHWDFDNSVLHMHLSARVAEVLACAEEMWEFIVECRQSPARWQNPAVAALAEVNREEWEDCLARYRMDMHDKIGLGPVVSEKLSWHVRPVPRTAERKAFDEAIEKWESHRRRREEQSPGLKSKTLRRAQPLSRIFRVFVAWKE